MKKSMYILGHTINRCKVINAKSMQVQYYILYQFRCKSDIPFFYLQVEVEDQKVMSLYRIQDCVKRGKVRMALSLLRASREVSNVTA